MSATEAWLNYAEEVVNCPDAHRRRCIAAGGAVPGSERVDGNELRWPGYLGADWQPGTGVLCVGSVHREAEPAKQIDPVNLRTDRELVVATRTWLAAGRSQGSDADYLHSLRAAYVDALPTWGPWKKFFRKIAEDGLGMSRSQIAYANLAKCRVAIHLGPQQRSAQTRLPLLCQTDFIPMAKLVAAIRPAAVLVCNLNAGRGGTVVETWDAGDVSPLVFRWHGQSGHDRHNTDPTRRDFRVWVPEAVRDIRARQELVQNA